MNNIGLDAQYDKNGKLISNQVNSEKTKTCGNCLFFHFFTDTCRKKSPVNSDDGWAMTRSNRICSDWIRRV